MAQTAWLVDVGYVVKASDGKFRLDYIAAEQMLAAHWGPTHTFLFNGVDPKPISLTTKEPFRIFYRLVNHRILYEWATPRFSL